MKIDEILKQPAASKAEKKARLAETKTMEDELRAKQLEEMAALITSADDDMDFDELSQLSVHPTAAVASSSKPIDSSKHAAKKVSRAQKRRVRLFHIAQMDYSVIGFLLRSFFISVPRTQKPMRRRHAERG